MVLEISQDTFNDAVQENIEILGLSEEEAIEEAVKQFEAQGVDLSKVIRRPMSTKQCEELIGLITKLEQLQKSKGGEGLIHETLASLKSECEKGVQQKVEAGKANLYQILLNTYETYKDRDVRINVLRVLIALMTKQPDLLDERGVEFIVNNLKDQSLDPELQRLILKWTKECCVLHEMNRQKIYDAHILDTIKPFLGENSPIDVMRETLSVCRALVLDDDVRVEFGRAHEHARVIASETLCSIMALLSKFKSEEQLNFDILLTLTALMVRAEFCKKVEEAGGLDLIKTAMETYSTSDKIIRQSYKLIKALAGNDESKSHMIKKGYANVIQESLNTSLDNHQTVTAGLAAVASLTLRSPDNSQAFYDAGMLDVIVNAMKRHQDQKSVQKTGSWAIRNMVSRSKYQVNKFLELGIEAVLQEDLKRFKEIEYDVKSALRDLGCKVSLKEEWTGKGGALTTGVTKRDFNDEH